MFGMPSLGCVFFNLICNKVVDVQQLEKLEEDIVVTMCLLEKYFPPSFFTIMMHLTVHIVREVKLCGPVYLRWMYPFERYMKVLKNYVRNRHHPEGCIAKSYIVKAIEFCSDFLSGVDPVGLGIYRLDASLDNSSFGRPLSAGLSFKLEQDLLYQAHRYVLANTIDVQPYIDKHVEVLQLKYPNKVLHQKWIQEEHNRTFISWLREEIRMRNVEISDNLRWIAHGSHPFVIKYNSYAINGYRYHTESYDKKRSVQNSGVSLVAKTMQVSSSKDKNPIIGDMSFYGVIKDIWELNYNTFNVAVFRCDWVENNNDKFFTLKIQVMLDGQLCLLHHREIVKINQMTMNLEISCYIVKEYLVICQISMEVTIWMRICQHMYDQTVKAHGFLNNTLIFSLHMEPTIVRDDQDKEVGRVKIDGLVVGVVDEHVEKRKQQRKQGPTIMFDVTRVRSEGERKLVEYNKDGVPIRENWAKLNSFIGSCAAFIIDSRSRKSILKTAGTTFRQFKHWLTKRYILPFKNEPEILKRPPYMYSYIDQKQWEEFVRSRLCPHFEKNIPSEESELDRASMWKKAPADKKGQYDNKDVQEVVNRIDEIFKTCADKKPSPNDVMTQALGTLESSGCVRGVGGFVTPRRCYRVRNEKEIVCESNIKMPLPLKTILRFAEKVMDKDLEIRYKLPFSLFGIGRKTCVLREDIIDFCNMREVKTLTLVAYMAYLHSQDELSNYIFVDPSLISVGHNTQEVRARNLCSRLMASKPNQLVLAPFNPSMWLFLGNMHYIGQYIDTRTSYSQLKLDEVRMELADFLGGHM
ncbi:hypothetical protein IC582_016245 [Cucumis melo]